MHEGTVKALKQTYESGGTRKDGGLSASFGYEKSHCGACHADDAAEQAGLCSNGLPIRRDRHIGGLGVRALLFEVSATPKPGLVDRENNGAHDDMDYAMFLRSARALESCFQHCAFLGRQEGLVQAAGRAAVRDAVQSAEQDAAQDAAAGRTSAVLSDASGAFFRRLRSAGLDGERAMYRATGGINTHKGLIFSLGILCAACGFLTAREEEALQLQRPHVHGPLREAGFNASRLQALCAQMAQGLLAGGEALPTHGQMVRQNTGLSGIKGEALSGFHTAFSVGLPRLRKALARGFHMNEAMVYALLHLMTATEDSNVVYRGGRQGLAFVRRQAVQILSEGISPGGTVDMEMVRRFDRQCIRRHLSPGGSADLLAVSVMLHFVTDGYTPG